MRSTIVRQGQHGFVLLSIFLLVLFALGIFAFTRLNSSAARTSEQEKETRSNHAKIRSALINFVSINGYLPCPADGAVANGVVANGVPVPAAASNGCTMPAGVVPWQALGLTAADVLDPYQNKISYRVYSGATGLTQARGATMVDCDSVRNPPPVPPTVGAEAGTALCRIDHDTSYSQFMTGKGFNVTDSGTVVPGVAFVLITHGRNGAGAFSATGAANAPPNIASAEYGNTQAVGPFTAKAANIAGLSTTDTTYFDDEVTYLTIDEMVKLANVVARDWPDPP